MDKQAKDLIDPQIRHKAPTTLIIAHITDKTSFPRQGPAKESRMASQLRCFTKPLFQKIGHGETSLTMPYCIGSYPCLPLRTASVTPFRQEKRERDSRRLAGIPAEFVPSPPKAAANLLELS